MTTNNRHCCNKCCEEIDLDYMTEGLWPYLNIPMIDIEKWLCTNSMDMDALYCEPCADDIEAKIMAEI